MLTRTVFAKLLAVGVCVAPLWCAAVTPYTPETIDPLLEPWRWRSEEALDGLGVLCMDEAADGTLWFGCIGGLVHYDGYSVTRVPINSQTLPGIILPEEIPWVHSLMILEDGSQLAVVGDSLLLRREGKWQTVLPNVGEGHFTDRLTRTADGTIWLLVPGALWRISGDLSEKTRVMQATLPRKLESFCFDASGEIWILEKLTTFSSRLVHIPFHDGRPAGQDAWREYAVPFVNTMSEARVTAGPDGLIWYADSSRDSGLETFDPRMERWVETPKTFSALGVYSILNRPDGSILGGTEGGMVYLTPEKTLRVYKRGKLDLPLVPLSLFESSDNRLWVIGRVGYVYSVGLGTDEWMTLPGLHFEGESPDGRQWFILRATDVVSHDPATGEWLLYESADVKIHQMEALFLSSHGLVWAIGRYHGAAAISVFDGTRWTRFAHPEFARWIEPHSVFEAADGTVWFGAGGPLLSDVPGAGGALQYEVDVTGRPRLLKHHSPPAFPYYVTSLVQTPDRSLWIGSTIIHRQEEGAATATPVRGLSGENSVAMTVDRNGALWVAKEHYGVCRRLENSWEVFGTADGRASLLFSDLLALPDGSLLASSYRGISRFDGRSWTAQAYSEWFGMGKRTSSMRYASDGALWFNFSDAELHSPLTFQGTRYGAVRHMPETTPPDTQITGYLKTVAPPGNTHITWTAQDPWGETSKDQLQYSWRMNGGDWSEFSGETGRTFLNRAPGTHWLEVRARDRAYNVDLLPARIEFVVKAPTWRRPWFVGMVALIVFGSSAFIWMVIYLHEKRLKERARHLAEMDRLKTSFFTNLSHELRTPLSVMLPPLQSLLRSETNDTKRTKLSMVIRSAERVTALLTQLLDFRKIEQGKMRIKLSVCNIVEPVRNAVDLLQPLAQARQVRCHFESPADQIGFVDADKLRKITSNLVGNAIKYTRPGGEVYVRLGFASGSTGLETLTLVVEDSGAGINPEHLERIFDRFFRDSEKTAVDGSGIGLNLTKELVDLLGGTVRAESPIHPDADRPGARFIVELPVGDDEMMNRGGL